jgi:hypothetical protein
VIDTVVFAGPSLSHRSRKVLLGDLHSTVRLLSPAQAGSLWRLPSTYKGLKRIVIIDGYFYNRLAILHREILEMIESGILVIGCSSMGALRAVELEAFGMVGYGDVFDFIKQNPLVADDEVSLMHEDGLPYTPYSIPLINLRILGNRLAVSGSDAASMVNYLVDHLSTYQFERRTWKLVERICDSMPKRYSCGITVSELRSALYVDYKSCDTDSLVDSMTRDSQSASSSPIESSCAKRMTRDSRAQATYGIDSSFIPAKGISDGIDSLESYSLQQAMTLLRLQGRIETSVIERALHKDQVLGLYPSLQVPVPYINEVTERLLSKTGCKDMSALEFATGLSKASLDKIIHKEALFRFYIIIKSDEVGALGINDLLSQELIVNGLNVKPAQDNGEEEHFLESVSTANAVAEATDLVSGFKFLSYLLGLTGKQLRKNASLPRYGDLLSFLALLRGRG